MRSILSPLLLSLPLLTQAAMGPAFSLGPTSPNAWIRSATSTLIVPDVPAHNAGDLSLWVGMGTSTGDLIQAITDQSGGQDKGWTSFAYTLPKGAAPRQMTPVPVHPGDRVTSSYSYNASTSCYDQHVRVNDRPVSRLSTASGHALGFGSAVECGATDCGAVGAHAWVDTRIVLNEADPGFARTFGRADGVRAELRMEEGGRVWVVGEAGIPEFSFF
ncbi:hypothetical protein Tdes44962_MAKER02960 [Teratosphaeria destructans]|uniref:Uncharacterized protein n=1 Tax=Teratosphaeria destructans TaxID=418781 RepID=A0A9W7W2F7_9PEZI|nr:hypothetical protein Tdes44962_MAKER02960 [Teratosphaeria destructans]